MIGNVTGGAVDSFRSVSAATTTERSFLSPTMRRIGPRNGDLVDQWRSIKVANRSSQPQVLLSAVA
jgi:hypothetical protein